MIWWVASILANIMVITKEHIYRNVDPVVPTVIPVIVLAEYCLYRAWSGASHWMTAWIIFTLGNTVTRVAAVYFFAPTEITSWSHICFGVSIMLGGAFLVKQGLS